MLIGVADHGKGDFKARHKIPGLRDRPHAHQDNLGTGITDVRLGVTQLRHLLAAERSAQVPQKNQQEPAILPELT